jgi:hypothetical protein
MVDVGCERRTQLVELAVARAGTEQHLELEAVRGKRPGQVVDQADAHRLGLGLRAGPIEAECGGGSGRSLQQRSA